MTDTATTPAAATPTSKKRRKAATSFDANPAKAGWFTKIVLAVICVLWMVPLLGTFITSFRTVDAVNSSGWWTIFRHPLGMGLTLDNYHKALTGNAHMGKAFINSVAITLPATFIPILIAAFAAYAFTFMEFWGRDVLFLTIVSLLVIPNYVAFIPIQKLYKFFGLNGTFPAVWLAHIGFGMSLAIYILRNYMATLPSSSRPRSTARATTRRSSAWYSRCRCPRWRLSRSSSSSGSGTTCSWPWSSSGRVRTNR